MNPEQWLSLKWNGGSTMSDRWLNQSKIIQIGLVIDKKQSSETQTYAIVEDKYTDTHMAGGVLVTNYYIEVKIGDQKKPEKIQITYEQYQVISKGSKVLCTIYYKKDKIVDVELATTHRKE